VGELGRLRREAGLDVAEAFPVGQLGERQDAEVLGARERPHAAVAPVAVDDSREGRPRQEIHQLCEQGSARVHGCFPVCGLPKIPLKVVPNSSRHRAYSQEKHSKSIGYDDTLRC